ncbi:putative phosphatidylserine decarboxylase proenzyme protein [Neofusicoccum parvum UCRNP2]|uniref:phosphatidylserine decarboxylase n=1 Tax=Botryosphaeria parva (strain UCR-NP2) TaxID=1287680 RepID=R1GFK8_BOTPV|nr:putative phosphatidylserine decarboxylase proenzyme protein [Neofusicoccum parvum UCRNP2]
MASPGTGLARPSRRLHRALRSRPLRPHAFAPCPAARHSRPGSQHRNFTVSARRLESGQNHRKESFRARLSEALRNTKIEWKPIPIALGVGFLGAFQFYRIQRDAKAKQDDENGSQVQVMSTLPLKALSRLWGRFNELEIPYYLRVPGFRLYSFIFGVNLDEMEEQDLHKYPNLAKFFYRTLKPGARTIDPNPNAIVSPADGKVVQFGTIDNGEVEQVKAESRRHFAGELYSVSPYLVRTLPGLFTLNERVVLLGRWRWGFFSYIPVGATNVGSIVINFDRELRTNSLTTDTAADRAAEEAQKRGEPYSGYAEATYDAASNVLGGHALKKGEEMGGFQLGSTIVLVFEAPKAQRKSSLDEGFTGVKGGWKWNIEKGQKLKVGQPIGYVEEE